MPNVGTKMRYVFTIISNSITGSMTASGLQYPGTGKGHEGETEAIRMNSALDFIIMYQYQFINRNKYITLSC